MNPSRRQSRLLALLAAAVLPLALTCQIAGAEIFVKFAGIDGEAGEPAHANWSVAESADWGGQRSQPRAAVVMEDFTIGLAIDKAAPKILENLFFSEILADVTVHFTKDVKGTETTYLSLVFSSVSLMGFEFASEVDTGDPSREPRLLMRFTFDELLMTYSVLDTNGTVVDTTEVHWVKEEPE